MDHLIACLPEIGGLVDLQPLFFCFTLDVTSEFLFGRSTHTLEFGKSTEGVKFAKAFDTAQGYLVKRFRLLNLSGCLGAPGSIKHVL